MNQLELRPAVDFNETKFIPTLIRLRAERDLLSERISELVARQKELEKEFEHLSVLIQTEKANMEVEKHAHK